MIFENIKQLIGNTPLLLIPESVHNIPNLKLYCKLEFMNAFGSIKDRIAVNMLKDNLEDIKSRNKTVLEASSGNTSKALAILSSMNGLKFKTISNRIKTPEMKKLLLLSEADVEELPGISECPDPNNPEDYMAVAKKLAESEPDKIFYTDQYFNQKNPDAHKETGLELIKDLDKIDYFFSFLGTAGSSTGIGSVLKSKKNTRLVGIAAERDNYVPGGRTLDELWEVGFYEKSFYDEIISGSVSEAIEGLRILLKKAGLLCGPTSGLSYKKVVDYFREHKPKKETTAVFVACDRLEQYMSYIEKYAPELVGEEKKSAFAAFMQNETIAQTPGISAEELRKIIDNVTIIDIRSRKAFKMLHLPNSINIPEDELENFFEQSIPFSKDRKLVVVCSQGTRSRKIAEFLSREGYNCVSLERGTSSWRTQS